MKKAARISTMIVIAVGLFLGVQGHAATGTDVGVFFGIKNADYSTDVTPEPDYKSSTGFMGGAVATGEFGGLLFRTGGYYAERNAEIDQSGVSADLKIAYIDVPVTLMYAFNDSLSVFGGAVIALKVNDDCSGNSVICSSDFADDIKSFYSAATFGLRAKFHPNWAGEISYEMGLSEVSTDTDVNALSLGAIFVY